MRAKKKILTFLTAIAIIFVTAGICSFNAFADTEKIYVTAEGNGYVACENAYLVDETTSLNFVFDLPYVISTGDGYFGFGIVNSENVSDSLIDSENLDFGYAVLFNDTTSVVGGGDKAVIDNESFGKTALLKRDYTYKATFDNFNGTFVLERKLSGSNLFSVVQRVSGLKKLSDGEYIFGIMFSNGTEVVLDGLSFGYTQTEANAITDATISSTLDKKEGGAFVELKSENGNKINYANDTPALSSGKIVVSVETSIFKIDGGKIGFAIGSSKTTDGVIGGSGAVFYAFDQNQGVTKYKNAELNSGEFIDEYVNVESVFTSGRSVKAQFDFTQDTFSLLVRFSEGSAFKEVFKDSSAGLPSSGVYVGIQAIDSVYLKASGISVYYPSDIQSFATEGSELVYDEGDLIVTDTPSGYKITLEEEAGKGAPCKFIYSQTPVTVAEGESMVVYLENIRWAMNSPTNYQKTSFTFANGNSHKALYASFYLENVCVSMQYDQNRGTYWLNNSANMPQDLKNQVVTTSITFYSLFKEDGNSIMAVFSPSLNTYSLYMKSAIEPDYTLWQTFTVPLAARDYVDDTLYVGFEMYGGMSIEVDDLKVYTAPDDKIAASDNMDLTFSGDGQSSEGGFILSSDKESDSYASFGGFTVNEDYDYLALEYSIESLSYTDASYALGFFLTDGIEFPVKPKVIDRAKEGSPEVSGSFIEGDTSDFYAFIASDGLTETMNDKMRGFMFHTGYDIRVLFSFKNKTATMQYKLQNGYSWNDITVYTDLSEYSVGSKVMVALAVEDGAKVALSGLRAYTLNDYERTDAYITENLSSLDIGTATLCTVEVAVDGGTINTAFIDEENVIEKTVMTSTELTLFAEAAKEYVFDGWYLDGVRVSQEAEYTFSVTRSEKYTAVFLPASYVVINNGQDKASSVVSKYFVSASDIGINPENVQKYSFTGWTIVFKEISGENENVVCKYDLSLEKTEDESNLLKDKTGLSVWGSLKNGLIANDTCYVLEEHKGVNRINFGMFSIVDRAGYENGALIINVPDYNSDYDENGNVITERFVEITANYVKKEVQTSLNIDSNYSKEYNENLNKSFTAFIVVLGCTAACVAVLILIKKRFI